jgi:hypothetical protein
VATTDWGKKKVFFGAGNGGLKTEFFYIKKKIGIVVICSFTVKII